MSTTELSMKMSLSPTNCRTMPDASVLSITFGTPSGSALIAAVAMVVPADPPRPRMPDTSPRAYASRASLAAPAAAFVTASPRSALFRTASIVVPASSKIRSRDTSAVAAGVPSAPTSTRVTATPHDVRSTRTKSASRPFVSSVVKRKTDAIRPSLTILNDGKPGGGRRGKGRATVMSPSTPG